MTFSIVVREATGTGADPPRFGVAVTTNNPGIGVFCPFVSGAGAVATQYGTHGEVGPRLLTAIEGGATAEAAVRDVLSDSTRAASLQVHALCSETGAVHHGADLDEFHEDARLEYGATSGPNWSVAGNCLTTLDTLQAAAEAYREADTDRTLADRLIAALEAGDVAGGDGRDNDARSAAVLVRDPAAGIANEWYNDLRVDASRTPLERLRDQYELAKSFHEDASADW